jgi:hypothetical protein
MSDTARLVLSFKTGVLKELHKRQLLTRAELEKSCNYDSANFTPYISNADFKPFSIHY